MISPSQDGSSRHPTHRSCQPRPYPFGSGRTPHARNQTVSDLVAVRSAPAVLSPDDGPEFASDTMADWAGTRTGLSYIPRGSPWRNRYVESFISRIRDECPNVNSRYSLLNAQVVIGDWKNEYNHHRLHSLPGYLPPTEYARRYTHQNGSRRLPHRPGRLKRAAHCERTLK